MKGIRRSHSPSASLAFFCSPEDDISADALLLWHEPARRDLEEMRRHLQEPHFTGQPQKVLIFFRWFEPCFCRLVQLSHARTKRLLDLLQHPEMRAGAISHSWGEDGIGGEFWGMNLWKLCPADIPWSLMQPLRQDDKGSPQQLRSPASAMASPHPREGPGSPPGAVSNWARWQARGEGPGAAQELAAVGSLEEAAEALLRGMRESERMMRAVQGLRGPLLAAQPDDRPKLAEELRGAVAELQVCLERCMAAEAGGLGPWLREGGESCGVRAAVEAELGGEGPGMGWLGLAAWLPWVMHAMERWRGPLEILEFRDRLHWAVSSLCVYVWEPLYVSSNWSLLQSMADPLEEDGLQGSDEI